MRLRTAPRLLWRGMGGLGKTALSVKSQISFSFIQLLLTDKSSSSSMIKSFGKLSINACGVHEVHTKTPYNQTVSKSKLNIYETPNARLIRHELCAYSNSES